MKEYDILGDQTYSDPSYTFSGAQAPKPRGSTPLVNQISYCTSSASVVRQQGGADGKVEKEMKVSGGLAVIRLISTELPTVHQYNTTSS